MCQILNDLGMPMLSHWVAEPCHAVAPGDCIVDQVSDVDCPSCLRWLGDIKKRQQEMHCRNEAPPTSRFRELLREVRRGLIRM